MAVWFLELLDVDRVTPGIWLEDLFVLPEHRGPGLGKGCSPARPDVRRPWPPAGWSGPCSTGTPRPSRFYGSLGGGARTVDDQRLVGDDLA